MGRIIAIDYGFKRTGLAWTDTEQMIATGLSSIDTGKLRSNLQELVSREPVSQFLLGYPMRMDGSDTHVTEAVRSLEQWLITTWPEIKVVRWDERFTSKMAVQAMVDAGLKRKKRSDKHLINQVAATIMLQEYIQNRI